MNLLDQLNRAVAYIEDNICNESVLNDISSVTTYSRYHFGRLFYFIADISLTEYVRKRKLSLAAMELQSGSERVLDIAVKYGYDSADSFTRAFVKQHGITPTASRKEGTELKFYPTMTFQIKIEGVQGMNWRIETKEAFKVVGVMRRFLNDDSYKLSGYWDEKFADGSLERLRKQVGRDDLMGVCGHIDDKSGDFMYMIALPADDNTNTEGFSVINAPASTWAVFRSDDFEGNPYGKEIPKLFESVYKEWLPTSEYEKVEGVEGEIYDMEIYGVTESGKFFEEVWISVRKS